MPTLWSDTVWVFVDYNKNGVMKRLPVTSATASAGTVIKVPNNDKGVWVAGNARSASSFSTTIKLFTSVKDVAGACAYASNYPPAGEYKNNATEISLTGTSPYEISLTYSGGGSVTVKSGDTFILPCNYSVTSFTDATGTPGIMDESGALPSCTAPGSTVNFTAFNPCPNAVTGAVWYLTDTRESKNIQTYKVKKMPDGRIWMVQNLMFGNCSETSFKTDNSEADTKVSPTVASGYVGHCRTSTISGAGYYYNWPAVLNNSKAFYSSTATGIGCSGTGASANACQGICPAGWHVPTGNTDGEFYNLHTILVSLGCQNNSACWLAPALPELINSRFNYSSGSEVPYSNYYSFFSSTASSTTHVYCLHQGGAFYSGAGVPLEGKNAGMTVRCVRNYL
jgi:uncharacterized protein (TIGR02145 family)